MQFDMCSSFRRNVQKTSAETSKHYALQKESFQDLGAFDLQTS